MPNPGERMIQKASEAVTRKRLHPWQRGVQASYTHRERLFDALLPNGYWQGLMHSSVEHLHGPAEIPYGENELVVLCLIRNGESLVRAFIEHHVSLGAKHIVFLDNGSEDETVSIARGYENVTVLRSRMLYRKYELLMKRYLIRRFGKNRWSLYVDVDEFFDYPYSGIVSLGSLLHYLRERQYNAVVAQMLDMFPEGPLSESEDENDAPLREIYRYYDLSNVRNLKYTQSRWIREKGNVVSNPKIPAMRSGIRKTLFNIQQPLTKHPLVFLDDELEPLHNGSHAIKNARVADFSCVLFHYTFVGLRAQAEHAVRESKNSTRSKKYGKVLRVLDQNPELRIKQDTSRELESVDGLVDIGFLHVSGDYMNWVKNEKG
jgi:hypothetical protein